MSRTLPYTIIPPIPTSDSAPETILIIHGAFCCAASHIDLAMALRALGYSSVLYSRRGRLSSPPHPENYSMATEVDDALSIMKETGARFVFGLSSGALISLALARYLASSPENESDIKLKAITIFEPVLLDKEVYEETAKTEVGKDNDSNGIDTKESNEKKKPVQSKQVRLEKQFQDQIAANDLPGAMTTAMFIVQMGPSWAEYIPQRIWSRLISWAMKSEDKQRAKQALKEKAEKDGKKKVKVKKGEEEKVIEGVDMSELRKMPTLREYTPTINYDFRLVREMAGAIPSFAVLGNTPVLLMSGTKSPKYILKNLSELASTLPNCQYKIFKGENHGMPMQKEFHGNPKIVAAEMDKFFKSLKDDKIDT